MDFVNARKLLMSMTFARRTRFCRSTTRIMGRSIPSIPSTNRVDSVNREKRILLVAFSRKIHSKKERLVIRSSEGE